MGDSQGKEAQHEQAVSEAPNPGPPEVKPKVVSDQGQTPEADMEAKLRVAFKKCDLDGSGSIDHGELKVALQNFCIRLPPGVREQLPQLIDFATFQKVVTENLPETSLSDTAKNPSEKSETSTEAVVYHPVPARPLPSVGSAKHVEGLCKRCVFFPRGRCENAKDCQFCHYDHPPRPPRKRKPKNGNGDSLSIDTDTDTTPAPSPAGEALPGGVAASLSGQISPQKQKTGAGIRTSPQNQNMTARTSPSEPSKALPKTPTSGKQLHAEAPVWEPTPGDIWKTTPPESGCLPNTPLLNVRTTSTPSPQSPQQQELSPPKYPQPPSQTGAYYPGYPTSLSSNGYISTSPTMTELLKPRDASEADKESVEKVHSMYQGLLTAKVHDYDQALDLARKKEGELKDARRRLEALDKEVRLLQLHLG